MKHDLTTGTWQDDTGCPISFVLAATSDEVRDDGDCVTGDDNNDNDDGDDDNDGDVDSTMGCGVTGYDDEDDGNR